MKKLLTLLLALAFLLLSGASAQALTHVSDLAGVLDSDEEASLERQAGELFEKTGFDVILHTTNDSQGKGPKDYSFDYYHAFRDAAAYPNGALFAVMFDTRDYYEAARGTGISLLSQRGADELAHVVQSNLSGGDYYSAMNHYLHYVESLLTLSSEPPEEAGNLPDPSGSRAAAVLLEVLPALLSVFVLLAAHLIIL